MPDNRFRNHVQNAAIPQVGAKVIAWHSGEMHPAEVVRYEGKKAIVRFKLPTGRIMEGPAFWLMPHKGAKDRHCILEGGD